MHEGLSDESLMRRYLEGDTSAFQTLLHRHGQKIYNFILRTMGDRQVAEDLLQEVMLRVVRSAASFQGQSKFTTWLYTIARNMCIDARRRGKFRKTVPLDAPLSRDDDGGATLLDRVADQRPGQDSLARDHRFRVALEQALAQLPEEQREVFVMRELEGLKFREIAEIVGIPENTVKSRMRYALEALRLHLAPFAETIR